jgi:hypothetical protein
MPESAPLTLEHPPRETSRDKQSQEITVQSLLGLNSTEIQLLMRLVAYGRLAREQVYGIPVSGHRTLKPSSVTPIISMLRKKLSERGIALTTIHGFGWGLPLKDRERILAMIKPRKMTPDVAAEGPHSPYGGHGCEKAGGGVE